MFKQAQYYNKNSKDELKSAADHCTKLLSNYVNFGLSTPAINFGA
jgi:hypothetical protein